MVVFLKEQGHTEASVDISKLANLNQSAVICEVMNEDGRMARLKDLFKFSKKHKIKIASIEDLIAYRLKTEKLVNKITNRNLKIVGLEKYDKLIYKNILNGSESLVIKKGYLNSKKQ